MRTVGAKGIRSSGLQRARTRSCARRRARRQNDVDRAGPPASLGRVPSFVCKVCGTSFDVPPAALEKYPDWTPAYCRDHSPARKPPARKRASSRPFRAGGAEEHLTRAQVLERYTGGPDAGVFTDGSSIPNPGPGGWGVVWVEAGEVRAERHGHDPDTTNNRMELAALIEAFRLLPPDAAVTVYSDSRLCIDTVTKWAPGWERKGWRKKGGPIKNLELVRELYALAGEHPRCRLEWIAAHAGHRWNEYADSLSTAWMRDEV